MTADSGEPPEDAGMRCPDRFLPPTPVGKTSAALAADPPWWGDLIAAGPQAVLAYWRRGEPTPVSGRRLTVNGVAMVEVTFLAEEPDPATEVMVHLNGLTDAHREDVVPALMAPIVGTPLRTLSLLLPADGTYGYRLVRGAPIDRDAGRSRAGWRAIHRSGRPDPRNDIRLPHAHGETSSVWSGPDATTTGGWGTPDENLTSLQVTHACGSTRRVWVAPGELDQWLVVHDGQVWRELGLGAALAERMGARPGLVLIDSGDQSSRAADLPRGERIGPLTRDVLAEVGAAYGTLDPRSTVVAGQSFGGLAAALTVYGHPELATAAIVQSGSFWFDPAAPGVREAREGLLLRELATLSTDSLAGRRFWIQCGTDEQTMHEEAAVAAVRLRAVGADVRLEQWRGGHDYAWWRHGLVAAVAAMLTR